MSMPSLCVGCLMGKHDQHKQDWGIKPGVIGGAWCNCPGDPECAERAEKAVEMMREYYASLQHGVKCHCGRLAVKSEFSPFMDAYCQHCTDERCDAYPGACNE